MQLKIGILFFFSKTLKFLDYLLCKSVISNFGIKFNVQGNFFSPLRAIKFKGFELRQIKYRRVSWKPESRISYIGGFLFRTLNGRTTKKIKKN